MVLTQCDNHSLKLTSLHLEYISITDATIKSLCENQTFSYVKSLQKVVVSHIVWSYDWLGIWIYNIKYILYIKGNTEGYEAQEFEKRYRAIHAYCIVEPYVVDQPLRERYGRSDRWSCIQDMRIDTSTRVIRIERVPKYYQWLHWTPPSWPQGNLYHACYIIRTLHINHSMLHHIMHMCECLC